MGAFVHEEFKKGFLLDEERVRKINDLITKRLIPGDKYEIKYKVFREDAFYYDTSSIDEILSEENIRGQKIEQLQIIVNEIIEDDKDDNEKFQLVLEFDKETGVDLNVSGRSRDFVFLLSSDIKEYVKHNVANCFLSIQDNYLKIIRRSSPTIGFLFLTIAFLIIMISTMNNIKNTDINVAVQSIDTNEKLNMLLRLSQSNSTANVLDQFKKVIPLYIILFILMVIFGNLDKILKFLFPANLFLIGKEKDSYDKNRKIRSNTTAGLIVSIIAGLIVWLVTK